MSTEPFDQLPVEAIEYRSSRLQEDDPALDLVEVFAGLATAKSRLMIPEVLTWTCRLLGCKTSFAWLVLRAWEESGLVDFPIFRRWRARAVLVRRPRVVVSGPNDSGDFHGVVQGMLPRAMRRELERLAHDEGISCGEARESSPWV
jgi:hypothetical protein